MPAWQAVTTDAGAERLRMINCKDWRPTRWELVMTGIT